MGHAGGCWEEGHRYVQFSTCSWPGKIAAMEPTAAAGSEVLKYRSFPNVWVVSRTMEEAGLVVTSKDDDEFNVLWVAKTLAIKPKGKDETHMGGSRPSSPHIQTLLDILAELRPSQRVNHYPGTSLLTMKDQLCRSIRVYMAELAPESARIGFFPTTFILPEETDLLKEHLVGQTLWIVKPVGGSNGANIWVSTAEELMAALRERRSRGNPAVVSRYVDNPLLIHGRKVDLRVYVLVTSFRPLRAYVYRQGLCRFSLLPYSNSPDTLNDSRIHLTNYTLNSAKSVDPVVQPPVMQELPSDPEGLGLQELQFQAKQAATELKEHIDQMGSVSLLQALQSQVEDLKHRVELAKLRQSEPELKVPTPAPRQEAKPDIKWTLTDLDRHLRKCGNNASVDLAWVQLAQVISTTLRSVESAIGRLADELVPYPNNCFELFGFDILLDDELKPWLIEVNLSPSMNCDTKLDHSIKGPLIRDTFTVVGVPAIPIRTEEARSTNGDGFIDCAASQPGACGADEMKAEQAELLRCAGTNFSRVVPPLAAPFSFAS